MRRALEPVLAEALAGLEPRDREVLFLYVWAGLGYADIAFALDLPVGTVKSRPNRARAHVRGVLDPRLAGGEEAVSG